MTKIRVARDNDQTAWQNFLDEVGEHSPLARYGWRHVLEHAYGLETHNWIATRAGNIVGVLSTYVACSLRGRRRLFSPRGGLVFRDSDACNALIDAACGMKESGAVSAVELTSGRRSMEREGVFQKTTILLPLDPDIELMWTGLRDKTRNMIRKAGKQGVSVVEGDPISTGHLYRHYRDNMMRLGVAFHRREFFEAVISIRPSPSTLLVAQVSGRPIATMLVLLGGGEAQYPYQNVSEEYRRSAAIQLLNWECMKLCAQLGYQWLDMGESRQASPVYKSKINFGGAPHPVYYFSTEVLESPEISRSSVNPNGGVKRPSLDHFLGRYAGKSIRGWYLQRKLSSGRVI